MGRKSLKTENVERILDAFERCIENSGLKDSTLEAVASEAGMDRRMVLHYIGKREDLIQALVQRIILRFSNSAFEFVQDFDLESPEDAILDYFFGTGFRDHPSSKLVSALLSESAYSEDILRAVKSIYDSFHQGVITSLTLLAPGADTKKRDHTAFVIMSLSFGGGWMTGIGFDDALNQHNKETARQLIQQLRGQ